MYGSILRKRRIILYKITFYLYFPRVQDNWHFLCPKSREMKTFQKQDSMEANSGHDRISFLPFFIPYDLSSLFNGILQ